MYIYCRERAVEHILHIVSMHYTRAMNCAVYLHLFITVLYVNSVNAVYRVNPAIILAEVEGLNLTIQIESFLTTPSVSKADKVEYL